MGKLLTPDHVCLKACSLFHGGHLSSNAETNARATCKKKKGDNGDVNGITPIALLFCLFYLFMGVSRRDEFANEGICIYIYIYIYGSSARRLTKFAV